MIKINIIEYLRDTTIVFHEGIGMLNGVKTLIAISVPAILLAGKFIGLGAAFGVGIWASRRLTEYIDIKLLHRELESAGLIQEKEIVVDDVYKGPERRRNPQKPVTDNGG